MSIEKGIKIDKEEKIGKDKKKSQEEMVEERKIKGIGK